MIYKACYVEGYENNKMFSKILYINLDHRQDRKQNVLEQLNKANINSTNYEIERLPGVNAKTLDFNNLPRQLFTEKAVDSALNNKGMYTIMTKGAIGCALAHRNAYLSVLNSNTHDKTLILEDDITIREDFLDKLDIYKNLIPDFDILWLGYHHKTNKKRVNDICDIPGDQLYGAFGYIINQKAAKKLLSIFPLTLQIDSEIPKIFPDLKVYALNENNRLITSPPSQDQNSKFGTDIQFI
jgi:GR25 family glycosyltransferase involved in LPS biosynthesis